MKSDIELEKAKLLAIAKLNDIIPHDRLEEIVNRIREICNTRGQVDIDEIVNRPFKG